MKVEQATVDEAGKTTLKALAQCQGAADCGEIAAQVGLPTPTPDLHDGSTVRGG